MKHFIARTCVAVLAAAAFITSAHAGIIRFTASLDAAQETTPSTSTATGTAVMVYDVTNNRLDLTVEVTGFSNLVSGSHIHEAPVGLPGGIIVGLGDETAYVRTGNDLTATFTNLEYTGDVAALLSGGAYINIHSAEFTAGEIRGQLIPEPVKLTAIITPEQETADPPVDSDAFGAAQATYDPMTDEIDVLIFIYNFTNTFTNSHFHEAPVGMSGGVVHGLGGAADYQQFGNTYTQWFTDLDYEGDPVDLLSEGTYLNFHSDAYTPGEIRGQLYVSEGPSAGRLVNVSARGRVGSGENVLITGMFVAGTEPVRVLFTGRGPFLADFGVVDALADPVATISTTNNIELFTNDDVADGPYATVIGGLSFAPTDTEAGILLLLPPGAYTNVVSSADGSEGVALSEAHELEW